MQIPPSLNSKAILQRARLLFLLRQHWRTPSFPVHQYFCRRQYLSRRQVFSSRKDFGCTKFLPSAKDFGCVEFLPSAKDLGCAEFLPSAEYFGCAKFLPSAKDFEGAKVFGCANVLYIFCSAYIFVYFLHSYLVCANNLIGSKVLRYLG